MKIKIIIFLIILNLNVVSAEASLVDSNKIFKNLRCLVCQGQSVGDSNSEFAQTIKLVVRDQIKEGKTEKEIYEYLKVRYGDWILYDPEFSKNTYFLWFLPLLIFLFGGAIIFKKLIKIKK